MSECYLPDKNNSFKVALMAKNLQTYYNKHKTYIGIFRLDLKKTDTKKCSYTFAAYYVPESKGPDDTKSREYYITLYYPKSDPMVIYGSVFKEGNNNPEIKQAIYTQKALQTKFDYGDKYATGIKKGCSLDPFEDYNKGYLIMNALKTYLEEYSSKKKEDGLWGRKKNCEVQISSPEGWKVNSKIKKTIPNDEGGITDLVIPFFTAQVPLINGKIISRKDKQDKKEVQIIEGNDKVYEVDIDNVNQKLPSKTQLRAYVSISRIYIGAKGISIMPYFNNGKIISIPELSDNLYSDDEVNESENEEDEGDENLKFDDV